METRAVHPAAEAASVTSVARRRLWTSALLVGASGVIAIAAGTAAIPSVAPLCAVAAVLFAVGGAIGWSVPQGTRLPFRRDLTSALRVVGAVLVALAATGLLLGGVLGLGEGVNPSTAWADACRAILLFGAATLLVGGLRTRFPRSAAIGTRALLVVVLPAFPVGTFVGVLGIVLCERHESPLGAPTPIANQGPTSPTPNRPI